MQTKNKIGSINNKTPSMIKKKYTSVLDGCAPNYKKIVLGIRSLPFNRAITAPITFQLDEWPGVEPGLRRIAKYDPIPTPFNVRPGRNPNHREDALSKQNWRRLHSRASDPGQSFCAD